MNDRNDKLNHQTRIPDRWFSNNLIASSVGAIVLLTASSAVSQENPFVQIEMPENNITIEGELVGFDDESFFIEGELGTLRVQRKNSICIGIGCPTEEALAPESTEASREVVLQSVEGDMRISGELIGVDSDTYTIRNILGEFSIQKSTVECGGAACPNVEFYDPHFAVHIATAQSRYLMADLLKGYAAANDQNIEIESDDDLPKVVRLSNKSDGALVAEVNLVVENSHDALQIMSDNTPDISILDGQQFASQLASVQNVNTGNLRQAQLAFDGQVIIGHRDNPVRNLSNAQISSIWTGEVSSWRPLGGGDFPITLHMVDEGSSTGPDAALWLASVGKNDKTGIVSHDTEADVVAAVQADRNAIGVVHRATAAVQNAKMLDIRKTCGLISSPTNFDMQVDQYPLTQPVYAYGRTSGMHPVAESFMDWSQTPQAQRHITGSGFVSTALQREKMQDMGVAVIHTAAVEQDFDGKQFASMMRDLRDADRLSMTFRFLPGSAALDDQSVKNVINLAERLRQSEFVGQEVLLVGFADSIGPANRNTILSQRRAESVQTLLKQQFDAETLSRLNITPLSYGEQMPLDCNDTDAGRANNRRVEVWVRVAS